VFIAAAALVAAGQLDAVGVGLAGAIGAAAGDQFYFYVLRRHLGRLLDALPVGPRRQALAGRCARTRRWRLSPSGSRRG
jgi:membrane protein DedA with SNARE-associated domain